MNERCKRNPKSKACQRRGFATLPRSVASVFWLAIVVLGASLLSAVPVARADVKLGQSGLTGRHRLADMYDSPGAVCDVVLPGSDSLGETWLRVNPPVMFARDRTPSLDEQYVGWQATVSAMIEGRGAWGIVRRSEVMRHHRTRNPGRGASGSNLFRVCGAAG